MNIFTLTLIQLVGLGCFSQASVLSSFLLRAGSEVEIKDINRTRTDDWVEKFYDQCGRTRNFHESQDFGNYKGLEVKKTCIGDRDNCIEQRNCYFAVAIEEHFTFQKVYQEITSTTDPIFERYDREIVKVDVKLLDTCHLSPLPHDQTETDKFVGLSFGTIQPNGTLDCDDFQLNYNIDNFRAFFFVKDFSQCDIKLDTPVHPYFRNGENDAITNQIEILPNNAMCKDIQDTIPDGVTFSDTNQNFMKYLTLVYYGTDNYTKLDTDPNDSDFSYADDTDFVENLGILRLGPQADKRAINAPDKSGSSVFHASIISSVLVTVLVIV